VDGWINVLPYSAAAYDALFATGGRDDLVGDSRTRGRAIMLNAEFLYSQLRPIIATRTTAEWLAFCDSNDIPVGSVATLDELTSALDFAVHPEAGEHRVIPPPLWFSQSPCEVATPAPRVGEHTRAVLETAGLSPSEIDDLFARGVARGERQHPAE
jgi:crotonobetainyl-CoA:carnitine CoA-transferase CaiB-like acyl-CoA transferase